MMPPRAALLISAALAFWVALACVRFLLAELPEGMHLASITRMDTLIKFHTTPASAWLDSVRVRDSLKTIKKELRK